MSRYQPSLTENYPVTTMENILWKIFPKTLFNIRMRYFERGWDSGFEWGEDCSTI